MFRPGRGKGKGRGGGISVVYRETLTLETVRISFKPTTFEHCQVRLLFQGNPTYLSILYRPPPSPTSVFFDELHSLSDLLESTSGDHLLLGDFNCPSTPGSLDHRLLDFLSDRGFLQLVPGPTREANLLDLVISLPSASSTSRSPPPCFSHLSDVPFSDHRLCVFVLSHSPMPANTVTFSFRDLRRMDSLKFVQLLRSSSIFLSPPDDPNSFAEQLDRDVTQALDIVAPIRTRTKRRPLRPTATWISPEALEAKRVRRALERKFRKSRLEEDRVA